MNHKPLKSGNISTAAYDPSERILEVAFSNGLKYRYLDVDPDLGEDLFEAPSPGMFLHRYILPHHDYEKIT
jgi:hypothetical protein